MDRPLLSDSVAHAVAGWLMLVAVGCLSGLYGFGLLLASGFRCDDGCGDPAEGWRYDEGSWVWELLGWSGLALLVLALVALVMLCVPAWRRWMWVPIALDAALLAVMALVNGDGDTLPFDGLLIALVGAAAVGGTRLTRSRRGRRRDAT